MHNIYKHISANWLLTAIVISYVFLSFLKIDLPGVYYDEVILVNQAYDVLNGEFPLIGNVAYVGSLKAYLHAPFVYFFGGSVFALRALPIFINAVNTILLYQLALLSFNSKKAAIVAVALFVFHPSIFFFVRLDDGPVSTVILFELLTLIYLLRALKSGSEKNLPLCAFFAGLGVWQKAYFAVLIISIALLILPKLKTVFGSLKIFCQSFITFLLGSSPLIIYNWEHNWPIFKFSSTETTNISVIWKKIIFAADIASGQAGLEWTTGMNLPVTSFFPWALGLSLIALLFLHQTPSRRITFLYSALCLLVTIQIIFLQLSGVSIRHYALNFVLLPLLLSSIWQTSAGVIRKLLGTLIFITLTTNLFCLYSYYTAFERTGGVKMWSDAIYPLTDYTLQNSQFSYLALDWGISESVLFLSERKANIVEPSWVYPGRILNEDIGKIVLNPNIRFISHNENAMVFPDGRRILLEISAKEQYNEEIVQTFKQRDGKVVFIVSRLVATN